MGFPSWSWAGWTGQVTYFSPYEHGVRWYNYVFPEYDVAPRADFGLRISVIRPDGSLLPIDQLLQLAQGTDSKIIAEISPVLRIESIIVSTRLERRQEGYFIPNTGWESHVLFCQHPTDGSELHNRVESEVWHGIVLLITTADDSSGQDSEEEWENRWVEREPSVFILLVDKIEGKTERIGSFWISRGTFSSMDQCRGVVELH